MQQLGVVQPDIWAVVADYYDLRKEFSGIRLPVRTPKKAPLYAERYIAWAAEQGINPHLFMRWVFELFARHKPGHVPALCGMRAKKLLGMWHDRYQGIALEQESFRRMKRVKRSPLERDVIQLRRKPTKAQEAARSDYASKSIYALCMLDLSTGGYDPRSKVCPGCSGKYACLLGTNRRHGFDVGALRVGVFARLPAEVLAALKQ